MFKNEVAEFIYKRTYSRWIEKEGRREEWPERRLLGYQNRPEEKEGRD